MDRPSLASITKQILEKNEVKKNSFPNAQSNTRDNESYSNKQKPGTSSSFHSKQTRTPDNNNSSNQNHNKNSNSNRNPHNNSRNNENNNGNGSTTHKDSYNLDFIAWVNNTYINDPEVREFDANNNSGAKKLKAEELEEFKTKANNLANEQMNNYFKSKLPNPYLLPSS